MIDSRTNPNVIIHNLIEHKISIHNGLLESDEHYILFNCSTAFGLKSKTSLFKNKN